MPAIEVDFYCEGHYGEGHPEGPLAPDHPFEPGKPVRMLPASYYSEGVKYECPECHHYMLVKWKFEEVYWAKYPTPEWMKKKEDQGEEG